MGKRNMRIVAVANQKGGVAKRATAVNFAAKPAHLHRRAPVVYLDPRRSATNSVFGNIGFKSSTCVLSFEPEIVDEIIRSSPEFGVDVVPSDKMLSSSELRLDSAIGCEKTIANSLAQARRRYFLKCRSALSDRELTKEIDKCPIKPQRNPRQQKK